LSKKIAIAHDFFFQNGGAENVIESWLQLYPQAEIFTTIFIPEKFQNNPELSRAWSEGRVHVTKAQGFFRYKNGFWLKYFKHFFWLYPLLMRFVTIKNFDLLLISSTDCAKQVRVENVGKIINYCHTPTRYLHGLVTEQDHAALNPLYQLVLPVFEFLLRRLDLNAAKYLTDHKAIWLANSQYIQGLIKKIYQVDSKVVYPPVDLAKFQKIKRLPNNSEPFFLCHGRVSFHKRLDVAILTCLEAGVKLKISGTSALDSQMQDLQNIVDEYCLKHSQKKDLIEFLGRTSDEQLENLVSECQAFLFPGKEDFGIAPIEMLAAGVPIVAYKAGGALEYVQPFINGIFVEDQEVASWVEAIGQFQQLNQKNHFKEIDVKNSALPFDQKYFHQNTIKLADLS
jgi:glycosyltransferase involved in cell wall biosynthesis